MLHLHTFSHGTATHPFSSTDLYGLFYSTGIDLLSSTPADFFHGSPHKFVHNISVNALHNSCEFRNLVTSTSFYHGRSMSYSFFPYGRGGVPLIFSQKSYFSIFKSGNGSLGKQFLGSIIFFLPLNCHYRIKTSLSTFVITTSWKAVM